jgi:hypothetical protein
MRLVMLGEDEGGPFHRAATIEDVKEFLYMLEMVAAPLEPTDAMSLAGRLAWDQAAMAMRFETQPARAYKAMIAAQGEG